jgi:hypothetical protein
MQEDDEQVEVIRATEIPGDEVVITFVPAVDIGQYVPALSVFAAHGGYRVPVTYTMHHEGMLLEMMLGLAKCAHECGFGDDVEMHLAGYWESLEEEEFGDVDAPPMATDAEMAAAFAALPVPCLPSELEDTSGLCLGGWHSMEGHLPEDGSLCAVLHEGGRDIMLFASAGPAEKQAHFATSTARVELTDVTAWHLLPELLDGPGSLSHVCE